MKKSMMKLTKLNKSDIDKLEGNPIGSKFAIYDSCGKMFVATVIDGGVTATHKVGGYQESHDEIVWGSLDSWFTISTTESKSTKVDRTATPATQIEIKYTEPDIDENGYPFAPTDELL